MKRVIAFTLVLMLLFSMAACGQDGPTTTAAQNPMEAMSGKYYIYHMVAGELETNYFQLSWSTLGNTCIELHADGKVTGTLMGKQIPEGNVWDAKTMTITNAEGQTNAITIRGNEMSFTMDSGSMTLLKEGDPRLDEKPEPYGYLYDHIVANGTQDEQGHTVLCDETDDGEKYVMTATADGKIFWKRLSSDGSKDMKMELVKDAQTLTITMQYNDSTMTATIEAATATYTDIPLADFSMDPEPQFGASSMESLMDISVTLFFMKFGSYILKTVKMPMKALGFTNYLL